MEVGQGAAQLRERPAGPQQKTDPVSQDVPVEGLVDEVGGAHLEGAIDGLGIGETGRDQDRNLVTSLANGRTGLKAVEHGHVDVEEHQVGACRLDHGEALSTVDRLLGLVPQGLGRVAREQPHQGIVVDDQDASLHFFHVSLIRHELRSSLLPALLVPLPARGRSRRTAPLLPRATPCVSVPRAPCRESRAGEPPAEHCST